MATQVTINGYFRCASFKQDKEYGTSVTIVELGEDYPQAFNLQLPDGHTWQKGDTFKLTAVTKPMTFGKDQAHRFQKFIVSEYTKVPVVVKMEEVKPLKNDPTKV